MFEKLETLTPDPILGLMTLYKEDQNPNKIDLGVGVYRDESGTTPIMTAVARAESIRYQSETTKAYIGPPGTPGFNSFSQKLILGDECSALSELRIAGVQTPGGCGALRVGAELIKRVDPDTTIWVSDPTWANHGPLLGNTGLKIREYPYYDSSSRGLNAERMLDALSNVPAGDVVLLHGCCHNPSGVDLAENNWQKIAELAITNGFIPFVDLAYQGLGHGLEEDAFGLRILSKVCPELIVANSYSKNFGLYRERVGSLQIISPSNKESAIVQSQLGSIVRGIYSMPPAHGAAIVEIILASQELKQMWEQELGEMRSRLNTLRRSLSNELSEATNTDFSFIYEQKGMFSFLGITPKQIETLKDKYSIYMVDSSRINIAGINDSNRRYFVESMREILRN
jgi:aspartate aminotransferase